MPTLSKGPTSPVGKPRTVVVTGADETFAARLKGFVGQLAPALRDMGHAFAYFDLGLRPETKAEVAPAFDHLVAPRWDFAVSPRLREAEPHLRALTVRPWLREYLPGYDMYVWIDTDVYVQHPQTIGWFIEGALRKGMTLVPQIHHAYVHDQHSIRWRTQRMHRYFGADSAQRTLWQTYYNAGIFAIAHDAPHWSAWKTCFEEGIAATRGELACDQSALNEAIHRHQLDVTPLPAICNWLCHLAAPLRRSDSGQFVEPGPAGREIAMLHMSAGTKSWEGLAEFWE